MTARFAGETTRGVKRVSELLIVTQCLWSSEQPAIHPQRTNVNKCTTDTPWNSLPSDRFQASTHSRVFRNNEFTGYAHFPPFRRGKSWPLNLARDAEFSTYSNLVFLLD